LTLGAALVPAEETTIIKATLTAVALIGLATCQTTMTTTGSPDPVAGEFVAGGSQGAHPPNTTRLGAGP
jgi:hypothetical protein